MVHFGAVDYLADVWIDGQYLGRHEGGQTAVLLRHHRPSRLRRQQLHWSYEPPMTRRTSRNLAENRTGRRAARHLVSPHDRDLAAGMGGSGAGNTDR